MTEQASSVAEERFVLTVGDGEIAGWRWVNPGAPRLLFLHATGFCASAYKQMLRLLAARFDVRALDLRGHGRTRLPADPMTLKSWDVYAEDVAAALDAAAQTDSSGKGWILAGHSCGAVVATLAARGRRDVSALRLLEPVAPPPLTTLLARTPIWRMTAPGSPMARAARRRRAVWPDRGAVRERYRRKRLFQNWAAGVLDDYLEDGLSPERDGGVRLSCEPGWEAATFTAFAHDFWGALEEAPAPVSVLGADDPSTTLFSGARGRLRKHGAEVEIAAGVSHLIPFEAPERAAAFIARTKAAAVS